jgi:hypothetical protein
MLNLIYKPSGTTLLMLPAFHISIGLEDGFTHLFVLVVEPKALAPYNIPGELKKLLVLEKRINTTATDDTKRAVTVANIHLPQNLQFRGMFSLNPKLTILPTPTTYIHR